MGKGIYGQQKVWWIVCKLSTLAAGISFPPDCREQTTAVWTFLFEPSSCFSTSWLPINSDHLWRGDQKSCRRGVCSSKWDRKDGGVFFIKLFFFWSLHFAAKIFQPPWDERRTAEYWFFFPSPYKLMTDGEQKLTWKCGCLIKILFSSENFSRKGGEECSTSTVLLRLHPPGDMSQGAQETNHEDNLSVCVCANARVLKVRLCSYGSNRK